MIFGFLYSPQGTSLELIGDDEQVMWIEAEVMRSLWSTAPDAPVTEQDTLGGFRLGKAW
jgi:hypothetical protein